MRWLLTLGGQIHFTPRHWLVHGDLALGSIAFVMHGGHDGDGNPVELHGTTSELVRRQPDGTWKYVIDHPFGGA
jgi:ketosteroid isomerase-like protein